MSDFEQIPEIAERIKRSKMELQDNGNYWAPEWDSQSCCDQDFVNNFKKGWQHQQAIIDSLKAQLNNMEACYIQVKKERDELQVRASELLEGVESAMVQLDNWTTAYEILDELRGERESFTETRQKVEAQIENGARLTKHQIDL